MKNETQRGRCKASPSLAGSADFFDRAESILCNVCQLVDGFKGHAESEGDWTEWDQQTRDQLGELLIEISKQNVEDTREANG